MPISLNPSSPRSPGGGQIRKGAFFRAKSPAATSTQPTTTGTGLTLSNPYASAFQKSKASHYQEDDDHNFDERFEEGSEGSQSHKLMIPSAEDSASRSDGSPMSQNALTPTTFLPDSQSNSANGSHGHSPLITDMRRMQMNDPSSPQSSQSRNMNGSPVVTDAYTPDSMSRATSLRQQHEERLSQTRVQQPHVNHIANNKDLPPITLDSYDPYGPNSMSDQRPPRGAEPTNGHKRMSSRSGPSQLRGGAVNSSTEMQGAASALRHQQSTSSRLDAGDGYRSRLNQDGLETERRPFGSEAQDNSEYTDRRSPTSPMNPPASSYQSMYTAEGESHSATSPLRSHATVSQTRSEMSKSLSQRASAVKAGSLKSPIEYAANGRAIVRDPLSPATTHSGFGSGEESSSSTHQQHLLLSLLAGQAVVDCSEMRIGGWEDVEEWKKELSILSSRLTTQIDRYQRETKILTAARTLAKLNEKNKRMSRQANESLEQAEQKVAEAEKEMLVLRDREAGLRRILHEHYAGVMAWEVKRMETNLRSFEDRLQSAQSELNDLRPLKSLEARFKDQESRLRDQTRLLDKAKEKIMQLEEETRVSAVRYAGIEKENAELNSRVLHHTDERQHWESERQDLIRQHSTLKEEGDRLLELSKQESGPSWETSRSVIAQALPSEQITSVDDAATAIRRLQGSLNRKDEELRIMKDEIREVSTGLEAEVTRIAEERDTLKMRLDEVTISSSSKQGRALRQMQQKSDELERERDNNVRLQADLQSIKGRLDDLQQARQTSGTVADQQKTQLESLRKELDIRDVLLEELWTVLPTPATREATGLVDGSTGDLKDHVSSPSVDCDLERLRALFVASDPPENYKGVKELNQRVRQVLADGLIVVERAIRAAKERELLKDNATRAQRLVQESQKSLATYHRQVELLEKRIKELKKSNANAGSSATRSTTSTEELDQLLAAKSRLERQAADQADACKLLREANDKLSQKALILAQEGEEDKVALQRRYEKEIEALREQLSQTEKDMDLARTR